MMGFWWCCNYSSSFARHHRGKGGRVTILFPFIILIAFCLLLPINVSAAKRCYSWCSKQQKSWTTKCQWDNCEACKECQDDGPGPGVKKTCENWCSKQQKSWTTKCQWDNCAACKECQDDDPGPGVKTFRDITNYMSEKENNWDSSDLLHSFRPSNFNFSPAFPDWNNDGFLDYVYPNHIRYSIKDWDFGLNVPSSSSSSSASAMGSERSYRASNTELIFNDMDDGDRRDVHGITFADMDNDGILDLLVSTGGVEGLESGPDLDNRLFWGKIDEEDGGTMTLEGGRETARKAGIECQNCRGRFIYVTDADRDGLLDVMSMTDARKDNIIASGVMQLNNGDRTFSTDSEMEEYANVILLTDADGDGYAQEYVVFRVPCFRYHPDFGDFSDEHKTFCNTRPNKTTAIYKYMGGESRKMTLISPEYHRFYDENNGKGQNKGAVKDVATGDFDLDQKADLAILFADKLIFYYSSNRKQGDLPLYDGNLEQQNDYVQMTLPCTGPAQMVRFADLDNDGKVEMVLACRDEGEIFVFKLKRKTRTWIIDTRWNLGDLVQKQQWEPTLEDLQAACRDDVACNDVACREDVTDMEAFVKYWADHCHSYQESGKAMATRLKTFSLIDLNNDGFLDVVAAHKEGYQRFFLNIPKTPKNRFIRFELKCTSSNAYAIGTTLIFKASELKPQFREISTFGQGNAGNGQVDDRIVFGLGKTSMPMKLTLRWPTGKEQIVDLSGISETHISNFANPVIVTEEP